MKKDWNIVVSIISLTISIIAIILSFLSNNKANIIAEQQLMTQREEKSIDLISQTYNKINWTFYDIRTKIYNNELIIWKDPNFQKFIDELEWLWWYYCDWKIKTQHLTTSFRDILLKTCTNEQVIKIYWGHKNGLSKLCSIYEGNQWMWKFFNNAECKILN